MFVRINKTFLKVEIKLWEKKTEFNRSENYLLQIWKRDFLRPLNLSSSLPESEPRRDA